MSGPTTRGGARTSKTSSACVRSSRNGASTATRCSPSWTKAASTTKGRGHAGCRLRCGFSSPRSSDDVAQNADALDLELDHVAALQPPSVAELEDAASADGAGAQHVPGQQLRVARSVRDDRVPRVVQVVELA